MDIATEERTELARIVDGPDGVTSGGERGLLGLAFHPGYASNGRYFVYYTPGNEMANRVEEWRGSGDDAEPVRILINANDPEGNHNGGMLAFGADGYIYVGMGDGGGGGDGHGPIGNALDLTQPFGKIHRLDVDNEADGFAAAGNPFQEPDGLPTIWAYGLRNPWRFSFDRRTQDLWIGDVGQGTWEEIDFQPAGSPGGANYGWRAYEGEEVFEESNVDLAENHVPPLFVYDHAMGRCSVTGGYVYRGAAIPALDGWYLYADYCAGEVRALRRCDGAAAGEQAAVPASGSVLAFGEDAAGEVYVLSPNGVSRIVAAP